ncbi:MAG: hypothetical protein JWO71_28 [Candidatus Acidoferrum typicum]|nr:hypothetical protein [Candidatus Acidoferrum typicum]
MNQLRTEVGEGGVLPLPLSEAFWSSPGNSMKHHFPTVSWIHVFFSSVAGIEHLGAIGILLLIGCW